MKIANIITKGQRKFVIKTEEGFLPVSAAARNLENASEIRTLDTLLSDVSYIDGIRNNIANHFDELKQHIIPESDVERFLPCVMKPEKIICIGKNYGKHIEETKAEIPEVPLLFNKYSNALAGHLEDIPIPKMSEQVDYEGELGIVIGKKAFEVSEDEALDYVFGYFVANDVSARDLQHKTSQWMLGKTCDKFAPIGPFITTADEIPDPNKLSIKTYVNGEIRQNSNTDNMLFKCKFLISYISQHFTLEPGDIILTGTPEGVIVGMPKEKRVWLKDGDVVRVEIENLGALQNTIKE